MNKLQHPQARLFKYHPIRFHALRNDPIWIDEVEQFIEDVNSDPKMALLAVSERISMNHAEGPSLLHPGEELAFPLSRIQSALEDEFGGEAGAEEVVFRHWHSYGEQIFDLSQIAAMFLDSDASEVPMNSVSLPFEGFYMYWGGHLRIPCPHQNRFIDGCYISRRSDFFGKDSEAFDLSFTTNLDPSYRWDEHSLLANLVVDAEGFVSCVGGFGESGTFGGVGEAVSDRHTYPEETGKWAPYLPAALSMAANCLCYLSWEKAEILDSYPSEAPAKLVAQTQSPKETERRRGHGKLAGLGFRRIRMCGQALAETAGLREGSTEVPPHWRRGHWRHQRHGAGRKAIKVIWIHAVVVNSEKGDPSSGHIYVP